MANCRTDPISQNNQNCKRSREEDEKEITTNETKDKKPQKKRRRVVRPATYVYVVMECRSYEEMEERAWGCEIPHYNMLRIFQSKEAANQFAIDVMPQIRNEYGFKEDEWIFSDYIDDGLFYCWDRGLIDGGEPDILEVYVEKHEVE